MEPRMFLLFHLVPLLCLSCLEPRMLFLFNLLPLLCLRLDPRRPSLLRLLRRCSSLPDLRLLGLFGLWHHLPVLTPLLTLSFRGNGQALSPHLFRLLRSHLPLRLRSSLGRRRHRLSCYRPVLSPLSQLLFLFHPHLFLLPPGLI